MRRWRGLLIRRGRYWGGAQSSPVPAVPPPQPARQAGLWPRPAARLLPSRRRWHDPGFGQGNQGAPYPSFTDPAGSRPRWGPRIARGRRYDPPWPQANQGQAWPSFTRQAGPSPRWAPRLLLSRSRSWGPGWPQGNQGQPWPSWTAPPGPRPRRLDPRSSPRRQRYFEPPRPSPALRLAIFTPGEPCFQWDAGTAAFQWEPGEPSAQWAAGGPHLS